MPKNLLIVESPAKAKTIQKYLGPDFEIKASVGHVKDLPVNRLGVDVQRNFRPEYVTIKGKERVLKELKQAGRKAETVYLAPDPDREGEAIAWHIAEELRNGGPAIVRVLFNELTAGAIREAVASPRELDRHKFESQQARRVLDRLVGYQISPMLWTKVKRGLSAGRVQSVAVRMICDREREIFAFEQQEYWSLTAHLDADRPPRFKARLVAFDGRKCDLKTGAETDAVIEAVRDEPFKVRKVTKKKTKKSPPPPFTTSLLQQEASKKLGFSAKRTMSVAQNLYEGVALGSEGQVGLITYMRTDSFRLSNEALTAVRERILTDFGADFLPKKPNQYRSPKGAQEAHEAVRPTDVDLTPDRVAPFLTKDQAALYRLIWKRFLACQMNPAVLDQTQIEVEAGKGLFRASGAVIAFKGFMAAYDEPASMGTAAAEKENKEEEALLPELKEGDPLSLVKLEPAQHFTQPPPRFTEATLIKALEENGIGRPSTYASILANISDREYVVLEKKRFKPTELGFLVTDLLMASFPDILDPAFTAQMETRLDMIEHGEAQWTEVIRDFYRVFKEELDRAQSRLKGEVPTGLSCPKCGRPMVLKSGKNGIFLACSGYPDCRETADFTRDEKGRIIVSAVPVVPEDLGPCELCGRPMVLKTGRYGPFLACSGYPECKHTAPLGGEEDKSAASRPAGIPCRECGARMFIKTNRSGQRFLGCERYPECKHTEPYRTGVACPEEGCGGTLVEKFTKKGKPFYACDRFPECRFVMWDEPCEGECPECGTRVLAIRRGKGGEAKLVCRKRGCRFSRPLQPGEDPALTEEPPKI